MKSDNLRQRVLRALFSMILGALMAVMGAFPASVFVALIYRFPIPVVGWVSGPEMIGAHGITQFVFQIPALIMGVSIAVAMYGVMGAYLVLSVLGALGGLLVHASGDFNYRAAIRLNLKIAACIDFLFAIAIANLDRFIKF